MLFSALQAIAIILEVCERKRKENITSMHVFKKDQAQQHSWSYGNYRVLYSRNYEKSEYYKYFCYWRCLSVGALLEFSNAALTTAGLQESKCQQQDYYLFFALLVVIVVRIAHKWCFLVLNVLGYFGKRKCNAPSRRDVEPIFLFISTFPV